MRGRIRCEVDSGARCEVRGLTPGARCEVRGWNPGARCEVRGWDPGARCEVRGSKHRCEVVGRIPNKNTNIPNLKQNVRASTESIKS